MSKSSAVHPSHLAEIPEDIRQALQQAWNPYEIRDLGLDGTLILVHDNPEARAKVGTLSRSIANRTRCPQICALLIDKFPSVSKVVIFESVALFLGLQPFYVRNLYYRSRRPA